MQEHVQKMKGCTFSLGKAPNKIPDCITHRNIETKVSMGPKGFDIMSQKIRILADIVNIIKRRELCIQNLRINDEDQNKSQKDQNWKKMLF